MTHSRTLHVIAVISFIVVGLSATLLPAEEAKLQIHIDQRAVFFSGISEITVKELAKINGFGDPDNWPEARTTGHHAYELELPLGIVKLGKTHPEWQLKRLCESRIAVRDVGKDRIVLMYRKETSTLLLLYHKLQYGDGEFKGQYTESQNGDESENGGESENGDVGSF